jgi:hypothetical protein
MPKRKDYKDFKSVPDRFNSRGTTFFYSNHTSKLENVETFKKSFKKQGFLVRVVKEGNVYKIYKGKSAKKPVKKQVRKIVRKSVGKPESFEKKTKIEERNLLTFALKKLREAERERKLNSYQQKRRQELKRRLKKTNTEIEKLSVKPEPINKKDKRKLKVYHYEILKSLRMNPDVAQRNIILESDEKINKSQLTELVSWKYITKSDKNRYSTTKQGRWRLKESVNIFKEKKRKEKVKKYHDQVKRLIQLKKELPKYKKEYEDKQKETGKIRESISEETKKEWKKHRFDYKRQIWDPKTQKHIDFKWKNPKEAAIIISMEAGGKMYKEQRKAYENYWGRVRVIKNNEELVSSEVLEVINKDPKELRDEIEELEKKVERKRKEDIGFTRKSELKRVKETSEMEGRLKFLKEWER